MNIENIQKWTLVGLMFSLAVSSFTAYFSPSRVPVMAVVGTSAALSIWLGVFHILKVKPTRSHLGRVLNMLNIVGVGLALTLALGSVFLAVKIGLR